MAPTATNAEILRAALTPEHRSASPTPAEQKADALLKAAQAQPEAWKQGLEVSAQEPHQPRVTEKAKEIGATRRNPDGSIARNTEDTDRQARLETAQLFEKMITVGGYDKLPPADQLKMRGAVVNALKKSRPDLATDIAAMNPAELQTFAENYLRNPTLAEKGHNYLQEAAQKELSDPVTSAETEFRKAKAEEQLRKEAFDNINAEATEVDTSLSDFNATTGTKGKELEVLRKKQATAQSKLEALTSQLDSEEKLQDALYKERINPSTSRRTTAEIDKDIDDTNARIENLKKKAQPLERDLAKIKQLEDEETTLKTRKKALDTEKSKATAELTKAKAESVATQINLDNARALRESGEEDLVVALESTFDRAANDCVNEKVVKLIQQLDENKKEEKKQREGTRARLIDDSTEGRWTKEENEKRKLKKKEINDDFKDLMDHGPESLLVNLLRGKINPDTGIPFVDDLEIKTFLQKNSEFAEKMQQDTVSELIARKFAVGGLTKEEIFEITMSPWGKKAIEAASEKYTFFKDQVEKLFGQGAMKKAGFWERLCQVMQKNPWNWGLLLAGGLIGAIFVINEASKITPAQQQLQT